jgi:DMSO reductase family type II enzyme heme b subunit
MNARMLTLILLLTTVGLSAQDHPGKPIYDKYCSQCHGDQGDGKGYAADYVLPKPRDFTTGVFKFRSTPSGYVPTDKDVQRIVREGIPGTSMPSFAVVGEQGIADVADYIKTFYQAQIERDQNDEAWKPLQIGKAPSINQAKLDQGRELYVANGCGDCHGYSGRADGPSALTLSDDYNVPIMPANLSASWRFRGGNTLTDIYRAFSTGLSGTPMPSYIDSLSDEQRWALAGYVHQLSPQEAPQASAQVMAAKVDTLPEDLDDEAWQKSDEAWFPLTAQIMWEPVNTNPTLFGVKVRALHDGESIAFLLEWDDPSFSNPNLVTAAPAAEEEDDFWGEEESDDGGEDDFWGEEESEEAAAEPAKVVFDSFAIQFPSGLPKTNEKPYFVMGDGKTGVNLWRWTNGDGLQAVEFSGEADDPAAKYWLEYGGEAQTSAQLAKGRDKIEDVSDGAPLAGKLHYRNGTYRLILKRALVSPNTKEVQLVEGQFIPIAFWGWDGHNGEEGVKASLSAWYWLVLEQPMAQSAYYKIGLAVLITLALMALAVRAAKAKAAAATEEQHETAGGGTPAMEGA